MNHTIIKAVCAELNLQPNQITPIEGGYQNHIFRIDIGGKRKILRLSSERTRSKNEILSEILWCQSLFQKGISVAKVLEISDSEIVCSINVDKAVYHAVLFEEVSGRKLSYSEYLNNEQMFAMLGDFTGRIHLHSQEFIKNNLICRPLWNENSYLKRFKQLVSFEETELHRAYDSVIKELNAHHQDKSNFGLIHGDINVGNFHVSDNHIIMYDFDECQFSWYVEDIAIQLFYTVYVYGEDIKNQRIDQGRKFMKSFLDAYKKNRSISDDELAMIPLFLRLREIIVYTGILMKWDFDNLNPWQRDYLRETKKRICLQIPLLKLDEIIR